MMNLRHGADGESVAPVGHFLIDSRPVVLDAAVGENNGHCEVSLCVGGPTRHDCVRVGSYDGVSKKKGM